ncbi:BMP family protein [Phormidium tenue FACHB-886]|nr:BMP family protein [Phormidium tenue FACHB-886]
MGYSTSRRKFLAYSAATLGTTSLLKACTNSSSGISSTQSSDVLRVGLLLPGSKADKGFMESGFDGLMRSQTKHGDRIQTSVIENVSAADKEQSFVSLAEKSDLVIGVGGQSEEAGRKAAENFPNVKFVIISATKPPTPNVASYGVRQAEIAFVAGAAAALLSKTGAVGYVGGFEIPAIVNAGIEFGNGAQYVKPDIQYYSQTTGDFDDVAKAKEAALAGISQGVDITYHILNLGLRGLEQAARETNTKLFGGYTARCGTDPLYVAYSVTGVGFEVEYAIDQMLAGTWKPEAKDFGLQAGPQASDVVICTGATPKFTQTIDQIKADIVSGKIKTLPA